jgi:hypothetical protein
MPARKSVACKPVTVVKQEPAVDQQPPQTKQVALTKQAAQAKQAPQTKQQLKQQQKSAQQLQQELRELQEEADAAAFDSDSEDPSSATGGGKRRRRIRNAKQQELNRLAQQRYRCGLCLWLICSAATACPAGHAYNMLFQGLQNSPCGPVPRQAQSCHLMHPLMLHVVLHANFRL